MEEQKNTSGGSTGTPRTPPTPPPIPPRPLSPRPGGFSRGPAPSGAGRGPRRGPGPSSAGRGPGGPGPSNGPSGPSNGPSRGGSRFGGFKRRPFSKGGTFAKPITPGGQFSPPSISLPLKEGFAIEERGAAPSSAGAGQPRAQTPNTGSRGPAPSGAGRGTSDRHEVKPNHSRKRGPMGAYQTTARMRVFKNEPVHKTGSDKDTLATDSNTRLKVVVMGGNEEVGRNMTLLEYGDDIILIDAGLQFPEEDMPGVDYIIPNISYLKGKEKNVRGIVITHAHYDHIGALPHISPVLGNPPIFGTDLSCGIIAKRQEDFKQHGPLNVFSVKYSDVLQLGAFKVEFFGVAHSIPSSMGVIVTTPAGIIVHTGDFKLDTSEGASLQETEKIKKLGERNVLALMIDSTNASKPGRQLTEGDIQRNLDEIIANSEGKVIISTFASMLARIQQIVQACERMGRKIAIEGFSMRSNIMIAQELGYMTFQKGTLIDTRDVSKYPRNRVAIICTGAQGQDGAALIRMANHEHATVNIEPGDTVVFSSSVIPGNERSVQRVKDTLYREGANVVHYQMMDVHAGGHAQQEDLREMHAMVKPKYLIPIEGNYSFLCEHRKAAVVGGFPKERIFIADNGQVMEFDQAGNGQLTNKKLNTDYVFVDGLGVGNTNQIVLRDRQQLAKEGVVIMVAIIDAKTGALQATPDIISRGFVYMKEHQELIQLTRAKAAAIMGSHDPRKPNASITVLKDRVRDELGEYLFIKTEQRPMIIPVIIEV